jgi:hypothetical protein
MGGFHLSGAVQWVATFHILRPPFVAGMILILGLEIVAVWECPAHACTLLS